MNAIIAVLVSIVSVAFSVFFGLKNSKRTDIKDIEERVKGDTRINMKLDEIGRNVKDTKEEISSLRNDINSHDKKIVQLGESCKQAHHRIDEIVERLNVDKG